MSRPNRTQVNAELKKLGFGGLEDNNLMQQLAFFIDSHNKFRSLLLSTHPEKRREAYEALRPHLRFTPKPLDVYEMEGQQKAEREQLPYYNPTTGELTPMRSPEISLDELAQEAIAENQHEKAGRKLELVCTHCTGFELFPAKTRKAANKAAHAAGWRVIGNKAYCAKHVPTRLSMKLLCAKDDCGREQRIRAFDEQDGYSQARLLGWSISDVATCPSCSAKRSILLM